MSSELSTSNGAELPPSAAAIPPSQPQNIPADEYDLGDVNADVEGSPPAPSPGQPANAGPGPASATPATEAAPAQTTPTRDPETGRFAKPARLVQMAVDLGLSAEEIEQTPTAELRDAVLFEQLRAMNAARGNQAAAAVQGANDPPAAPPATPPAGTPTPSADQGGAPTPAPAGESFDLPTTEDYDPKIRSMAQAVRRLLEENKSLKAQVGQTTQHIQAQANQTITEQCDAAFAKHPGTYGAGKITDYKPTSPEMIRRNSAVNLAKTLDKGLSIGQRIEQATALLFGTPQQQTATAQPGPTAEEWNAAGLTRPTQRKGAPEERGYQKAVATATRVGKEMGLYDDSDEVLDGFPE